MKRVFGVVEAVFDVLYLILALLLSLVLLFTGTMSSVRILAGIMAFVLVGGDSFHLIPRVKVIVTQEEEKFRTALGRGKQVTSITMTVFYILLWQIGVSLYSFETNGFWTYFVYALALVRILLCLFPQNKWTDRYPPVKWGIWRNIPFFIMGMIVAGFFFWNRHTVIGLYWMWLGIFLSFTFYLPVVVWSNKNPKIGMLMLPKTCMYIWMLVMCLSL